MNEELENTLETTEEEEEAKIQYHILDDPGLVHYTEGLTYIFTSKIDEVNQRIQKCETQLNEVIGFAQDLEELI